MEPIGIIHSCFKEKFGIPRQAGLAPAARAELELFKPYGNNEAVRGLEAFSHIWVIFLFHKSPEKSMRSTVRPPRLGGNRRIGVFASRSGFRPNAIGMSAVRLDKISLAPHVRLFLSGADILDKTPVLDIKPYIPFADCLPGASGGFASEPPPEIIPVVFSKDAETFCRRRAGDIPLLKDLIVQIIRNDPRPAYYDRRPKKSHFGTRIYDVEVKWTYREDGAVVTSIRETDYDR